MIVESYRYVSSEPTLSQERLKPRTLGATGMDFPFTGLLFGRIKVEFIGWAELFVFVAGVESLGGGGGSSAASP